ncbi:MAG TPA: FecR domain-containing protein, partial [Polyangia bacterium]|nr:FecR domain-containing protein [Polyangia bacterium]
DRDDVRSRMSDDDVIVGAMADASRRIAFEDAGPGPTPAVWHRLQTRRARAARPPWRGMLVLGAGAAAAIALVLVARGVQRTRPLTYVVAAGAAEQDGYIRGGQGSDGSRVQFSDGTHVDLGRGARVSVLSRGPRGARLRVEEGEARFDVAHLPRAAWSVEAGPYVVYVTGTVFDVRWSGGDEVIEVRMRSGSVQVGGPLLPERVTLRAGQRLTAKLASGEMVIGDARIGDARAGNDDGTAPRPQAAAAQTAERTGEPPVAGEVTVADAPAAAPIPPLAPSAPTAALAPPAPAPERAPAAAPPARPSAAAHRAAASHAAAANAAPWAPRAWSSAITSGNAARVVAEAEGHGIEKTLLEVDGGALMALSDASRYSGRPEMAVRALMAERQRFPDTPFAHAAAFLLGKLADDHGEVTTGLAWYRRYLAETPDGPYAAEALGRKMLAVERLSGRDAARGIAAEYVERFPNGTYMLQAHAILANPSTP